jgi:hypothetical protein
MYVRLSQLKYFIFRLKTRSHGKCIIKVTKTVGVNLYSVLLNTEKLGNVCWDPATVTAGATSVLKISSPIATAVYFYFSLQKWVSPGKRRPWPLCWPPGQRRLWQPISTCCAQIKRWVNWKYVQDAELTQSGNRRFFWRTFHHDGKISPGWWGWWGGEVHALPLSIQLPSRTWKHLLIFRILTETFFTLIVAAFRKPPVFLKSLTHFKNYLTFPASSPAYGTFYRITGCFMNAATMECKFCCGFR